MALNCRFQKDLKISFSRILFAYMNIRWTNNVRSEELLQGIKRDKNSLHTVKRM